MPSFQMSLMYSDLDRGMMKDVFRGFPSKISGISSRKSEVAKLRGDDIAVCGGQRSSVAFSPQAEVEPRLGWTCVMVVRHD
jgi:hypothetical protein